ncbi:uncharacterized protein PITG_05728 [Phytophthora infestans T30-4]|uniref:Uncharacterized protein n=1 Tax=Phytophthora infestans (strain T30-4) TaxID=403677 RepID=D0N5J4_PHYIT|nr:uncharacterized protein PITG_05728 [Phytophthora infestans T30-4]EEY70335.1 hypothetical protein PITG_05728 [Phytophthora infestans T30-4]|eukprot:XP_002997989.1 hypothetical protein PITG_05728 [Phytophthora infestans T30-4]
MPPPSSFRRLNANRSHHTHTSVPIVPGFGQDSVHTHKMIRRRFSGNDQELQSSGALCSPGKHHASGGRQAANVQKAWRLYPAYVAERSSMIRAGHCMRCVSVGSDVQEKRFEPYVQLTMCPATDGEMFWFLLAIFNQLRRNPFNSLCSRHFLTLSEQERTQSEAEPSFTPASSSSPRKH